jgi:hypothetical protein
MRSRRPTPRISTPVAPALKAGTVARVNVGGLPTAAPDSSAASQRTTDAAAHPSLIALARILGRQAGREWLNGNREGGSNGK